eukprot:XP_001690625.1 predicted protein [Chlamydomonas reinhardtii]
MVMPSTHSTCGAFTSDQSHEDGEQDLTHPVAGPQARSSQLFNKQHPRPAATFQALLYSCASTHSPT